MNNIGARKEIEKNYSFWSLKKLKRDENSLKKPKKLSENRSISKDSVENSGKFNILSEISQKPYKFAIFLLKSIEISHF